MCEKRQNADSDTVAVTPEMIEAGINAYYFNKSSDWSNPCGAELDDMMRAIFLAMWSPHCSQ
jgi:hypothetical protein